MGKIGVLFAVLSFSVLVQAAVLNSDVKTAMIEAVAQKCAVPQQASFELNSVSVAKIKVDQGVYDLIYSAYLEASYLDANQASVTKSVFVRAAKYAVSNPQIDSIEVLSVDCL